MDCSKCNLSMELGLLVGEGGYWRPASSIPSILRIKKGLGSVRVDAYKCPNCGKIELYIPPEK